MLNIKNKKMNIKDTIRELELENVELPRILSQRVNAVENLDIRLEKAVSEYEDNPTEDNEEKLDEVRDYVEEYKNDVVSQLKIYKSKVDKKAQENNQSQDEPKDKKNGGVGVLIGAVLLVATLGAVNVLNKK